MAHLDDTWRPYLDPEEVILWQGRPQLGWSWRAGENGTILLGLFIIAFLIFATYDMIATGQTGAFGGLLVWVGIAVVIGAFGPVAMAVVRRGTWYTLTDRRALIAQWPTIAGWTVYRGVDCYPVTDVSLVPADVPGLSTVNFAWLSQRYTFHHIWIRAGYIRRGGGGDSEAPSRDQKVGFERITDGADVAQLCQQVQEARKHQLPDNLPR